jgi:hypothetical protein
MATPTPAPTVASERGAIPPALLGAPTGFGATLVVTALIARRVGPWWRGESAPMLAAAEAR